MHYSEDTKATKLSEGIGNQQYYSMSNNIVNESKINPIYRGILANTGGAAIISKGNPTSAVIDRQRAGYNYMAAAGIDPLDAAG